MDILFNSKVTFKYYENDVSDKVKNNLIKFIRNRGIKNIVYRGVSNDEKSAVFTTLVSEVGEKGNYFRKQHFENWQEDVRKNLTLNNDKLSVHEVMSHCRNPGYDSRYVSTTLDYDVAKIFAEEKGNFHNNNSYIIMVYMDIERDEGTYKKISRGQSDFFEEKEITFLHALFANRIIGVYSKDNKNEYNVFNINPHLAKYLERGVPDSFYVDQTNFPEYKERLNYQFETWRE